MIDASEVYASCKKLIFKVDLIIKNAKGEIILEKKLSKFSEIFDKENRATISLVCQELAQKAKYIVEERHELIKQQEELNNIDMIDSNYLFLDEHFQRAQSQASEVDLKNAESAVEIYFSFYTIPQTVGLIRDQEVDFLCYEQDEILVNDDDHEDLIRVTKLNGQIYDQSKRLEFEDLSLYGQEWPLYRQFNKKQLVKCIPYYFKNRERAPKDYRIYYYDEIQRKIIYGILRRTYALIAQSFLEYLTLVTKDVDSLNLIIQQKYFGALLHNQRKQHHINVLDNIGTARVKTAEKLLSDELK